MENKEKKTYMHRFLARVIIEAETPIAVGAGDKSVITDALAALDVNGLPYIPGTSIAGVIRHALEDKDVDTGKFFGFQNKNEGEGSRIIFSDAKVVGPDGKAVDGLKSDVFKDAFFVNYKELPIRQHVRINHRGTAEKHGKFDEQVVFAGSRFCLEMEMLSDGTDFADFESALKEICRESFRLGGGTRSGFGKVKVVSMKVKQLNLNVPADLDFYLSKSSSLSVDFDGEEFSAESCDCDWIKYELTLRPDDFFLFGSGFGDDEVDMTPVKTTKVGWTDGKPELKDKLVLIPATSLKGALAHRTAYHYNKAHQIFADGKSADKLKDLAKENKAVLNLFGSEGTKNERRETVGQTRGNVIFNDIIGDESKEKILNHVSIDRFTGGAIDGALFSEKTTDGRGKIYATTILVKNNLAETDYLTAFENALKDVCNGMLPLGGGVNRGNGIFTGSVTKNGKEL